MFMLLWVGDRLAVKKKKTTGPENLAAVTPVLDSAPTATPPTSTSDLAEELNFIDFFGFTGVFVAIALLAAGGLTLFLGYKAENRTDIETVQAACFYAIAVLAVVYWFTSVMLWREVVNNLVDVEEGRVDPLAALDKIPAAKNLMKWYHDRFAIHTGGRYSLVVVISAELFELVVQANNANTLAKYLDWNRMQLYGNVFSKNYRTVHGKPARTAVNAILSLRDVTCDEVWKKVVLENGKEVIVGVTRSCELPDLPPEKGFVRANSYLGYMYFKDSIFSGGMCGFGVDRDPNEDTWVLDVSRCGLEEFVEWKDEYADLEVLDLSDNELVELPGWLGEGRMGKLRELQASGNNVEAFVDGMLTAANTTNLTLVDLQDNAITHLPYEVMDVEGGGLRLLFDGNPCAEDVDWSGLGVDQLPVRMMEAGYDNGNFSSSLRVLKLAHNELDEGVFEELVAANFTKIEELDVSWNRLRGLPGEDLSKLVKLRKLDVSGHAEISAE
ncbi:hypothetical protein TeGR_g12490 [Tetraparma gracilis]|uniref:Leucine-rich repeat domain-containing protein n=1 Tax=Tetraparma gracilis TaxID=2962635 RepID=A0ABQ6MWF6_9STRA|nr:hypothetical protein TeGR_g12490 [Tetraparma gracilis]